MSAAGAQKKRSRFAKLATTGTIYEAPSEYHDDYMAPLEALLPATEFQAKAVQVDPASKQRKVTLQELMDESREKGLAAPIDSSNTGFKLLKKFGYKEGEGLGKEGSGTVVPVEISKRTTIDASGLGVLEKKERKQKAVQAMKAGKKALVESLERNFRSDQIQQRANEKRLRDMRKAQKVIYALDEAAGVAVHRLTAALHQMYIDRACGGAGTGTGSSVRQSSSGGRQPVASDSRMETGDVQFACGHMLSDRIAEHSDPGQEEVADVESDSDSDTNRYRDKDSGYEGRGGGYGSGPEEASWLEEEEGVTLEDCLAYLRDTYHYCYYCGVRYHDRADLEASCPGETEEDH